VIIEDGQTLAIGGLIQNQVVAHTVKVPVLGDLPYLGAAFSSKTFLETEMELVVLVTPHLVDPMACNQVPHLVPGQETRSPDDCELFLEGILEAPRGPREVCQGGRYVPAYKNGPTADVFPCAGGKSGLGQGSTCPGRCGTAGAPCGAAAAGAGTARMAEVQSQPLAPVAEANKAARLLTPEAVSKSTDASLPQAPTWTPEVLPSVDATKAPATPAGEDLAPVDPPAKPSPFVLPSVGEGSGTDGKK
jgi:pilus assembly protein CpaC